MQIELLTDFFCVQIGCFMTPAYHQNNGWTSNIQKILISLLEIKMRKTDNNFRKATNENLAKKKINPKIKFLTKKFKKKVLLKSEIVQKMNKNLKILSKKEKIMTNNFKF